MQLLLGWIYQVSPVLLRSCRKMVTVCFLCVSMVHRGFLCVSLVMQENGYCNFRGLIIDTFVPGMSLKPLEAQYILKVTWAGESSGNHTTGDSTYSDKRTQAEWPHSPGCPELPHLSPEFPSIPKCVPVRAFTGQEAPQTDPKNWQNTNQNPSRFFSRNYHSDSKIHLAL